MTITLELTVEVEQAIERKARRLGITASEYVRRITEKAAKPSRTATKPKETKTKTPAEFLDELETANFAFGYGDQAIDSQELARQMRHRFSQPSREAAE